MPFRLLNAAGIGAGGSPQTTAASPTPPLANAADTARQGEGRCRHRRPAPSQAAGNPSAAAKAPVRPAAVPDGLRRRLSQIARCRQAAGQKCRVWTASYGGQKALIIRSLVDKVVNYTVLDVNEGAEKREAEAFISAYAKEGKIAGEFSSQAQALDKAFELCPEG